MEYAICLLIAIAVILVALVQMHVGGGVRKQMVALVSGAIGLAMPISAHSTDVRWMNLGNQKDAEQVAYLAGVAVVIAELSRCRMAQQATSLSARSSELPWNASKGHCWARFRYPLTQSP